MRHKVRWVLLSPEGEEERTGLSFGEFDERSAVAHAMRVVSVQPGHTLHVYLDGQLIDARGDRQLAGS